MEATNGQECIDYIKQYGSGISLILLDIIMPEIDGFDVLQWMEQEKWLDDIPVILISSEDSANIINKGFRWEHLITLKDLLIIELFIDAFII